MKAVFFFISTLFPVGIHTLFGGNARVPDLCREVDNCNCLKDHDREEGIRVVCRHFDVHEIFSLPLLNVTKLELLADAPGRSERKVLEIIRESAPNLEKLELHNVEVNYLDLGQLPDGTKHLVVIRGGLRELRAANCTEENRRLEAFDTLYISQSDNIKFTCFPRKLKRFVANGVNWQADNMWPRSLDLLKIIRGSVEGDPANFFQDVGSNLSIFWVTGFPLQGGTMPILPRSEKLRYVTFQLSNISTIAEDAFLNRSIRTVNLGRNNLSVLNAALPSTTRKLYLYWNQFEEIPPNHWADTRLTVLNLDQNFLRSVPLGLPKTLQELSLHYNAIETCSPEAFFHLKNLTRLDLSNNRLTKMPTGLQPSMTRYNIQHNTISLVPGPQAYKFCRKCTEFKFAHNKWFCDLKFVSFVIWISSLPTIDDYSLFVLKYTGQTGGKCTSLPQKVFSEEYVEEATNYNVYIEKGPFSNCSYETFGLFNCTNANLRFFPKPPPDGLKKVYINGNRLLKLVPDHVFVMQSDMETLLLEENSLTRIPYGLPVSLKLLSLSDNNMTELSSRDIEAFENLTNLEELLLHDNHIKRLLSTDFEALTSLKWLGADNNELVCDCSLHSFVIWYGKMYPFHYNSLSALPRYANCAYPPSTQGRELQRLRFYYTYELQCVPSACQWDEESLATVLNCSRAAQTDPSASFMFHRPEPVIDEIPKIPPSLFWQSIILSDLELEDDDIWLKHLTGLKLADLSGNRLTKWPTAGLPTSMETLVLNNNVITHLPRLAAVSRCLPNLKTVDLRNNKIVSLDPHELQTIFSIKYFRLSGNLLECNCHLMALVTWAKAEDSDSFNDKNELLCFYPSKLNGVRLRDLVDDEFCAKAAKLNPKMWVAYAMSLIVLMLIAILMMFVNKRRRYKAQILEGFQKLLLEETSFNVKTEQHGELEVDINGEAFAYDAFVATDECSQGTEFLEELIQELEEKRKHCLCVSIRDFVPGIDMAENIVSSIRTSKRVILLMSKSFVQSPWCQYGVQVALAELHQRQRKLLIPIILNDLDADTSSCLTVRTFTSLIPTYKAPKKKASQREREKFWNSVENVMN